MRRTMSTIAAALFATGGLAVFLPAAAQAQTAAAQAQTAAAPQNVVVTASSNCTYFCFTPAAVTVVAGGTVTWVNKSGTAHTIARCTPANCAGHAPGTGLDPAFTAAELAMTASGSVKYTFATPGTYVYYCTIHGYALMHGTITVTAAPPTTAPPTTPAPISGGDPSAVPPPPAPPAGPTLASTGSTTSGELAFAMIMIVSGLAAAGFGVRRRPRRGSV
jgi:plastocyanin